MKQTKIYLLFITVTALLTSCFTQVQPTEAGFKIENSGSYRGIDSLPLLTGYNGYMPGFSKIVTIPITQQHIVWTDDLSEGGNNNQEITVACMGGSGFKIDVGLNYRVNPFLASKIYLKYNTDDLSSISQTYLRNVVRGAMQDVSGTITVDSLLNNVPAFEHTVYDKLKVKLDAEGFTVDLFNILSQPRPVDAQLAASIQNKIRAKQDAQTSIMQLQQSIAEANKDVAKARGDSASRVISALGEAEAVKKLQEVLTPTYVQYIQATRWDGKLPTVNSGTGGMILQLKQQ